MGIANYCILEHPFNAFLLTFVYLSVVPNGTQSVQFTVKNRILSIAPTTINGATTSANVLFDPTLPVQAKLYSLTVSPSDIQAGKNVLIQVDTLVNTTQLSVRIANGITVADATSVAIKANTYTSTLFYAVQNADINAKYVRSFLVQFLVSLLSLPLRRKVYQQAQW